MIYLRMKLNGVKLLFGIFICRARTGIRICRSFKAFRYPVYIIGMAHPAYRSFAYAFKEQTGRGFYFCFAIFADRRRCNASAKLICHKLRSVAYSQNRNVKLKYSFIIMRRFRIIHAVWSAGKNYALRIFRLYLVDAFFVWHDLAIHIVFADAPRYKLIILSAKIENYDQFILHLFFLLDDNAVILSQITACFNIFL